MSTGRDHTSQTFADRLQDAIELKRSCVCVGIDPIYEKLPEQLAGPVEERDSEDVESAVDAIFDFTTTVLRAVAPYVPLVKFQSAYFERYLWEGIEAYYSLVQEAHELGLLVIGDVKRGDIGSTAQAYAAAHLSDPAGELSGEAVSPDAITVNPMLGLDTIEPFIESAKLADKGMFVLLRTSNPGSALLQDVELKDGRTWSQMLADELRPLAEKPELMGRNGMSSMGMVVGATQPHVMRDLRERLPNCYFLLPGYGAQGATAENTRNAFIDGRGAIVSASRSILYAFRNEKYAGAFKGNWPGAVQQAVLDMNDELAQVIG